MIHLPECLAYCTCEQPPLCTECICDALRSCQQRVIAEGDEQSSIAYSTGYSNALDAAEQAVAMKQTQIAKELVEHLWSNEYPSDDGDCCAELVVNSAIAAIRWLREEK